ncbi:MAG: MFS transporter [Pseudomonadota bacterium]
MNIEARMNRNLSRTLWLAFFQVFLIFLPIAVPFFQSKGLSMQEVFALQALFAVLVVVMEVPSGYLADLFGRRRMLIVGSLFSGLGTTVLLFAEGFVGLALFEACLAVAHSLVSGADIAMAYDSALAARRDRNEQAQVVGRLYAARTLSEASAALLLSALLIFVAVDTAMLIQAVIGWLPLLLSLTLVEPPGPRLRASGSADQRHGAALRAVWVLLWQHSAVLRLCFLALCIWSLTTFNAVWLVQQLWTEQGVELKHFGYLWSALALITALSGRYAHQAERALGVGGLLSVIALLPVFGYLLLDQLGVLGGVLVSVSFFVARGLGLVVLRDALNRRVPSEIRATANSLASFGFRGAFAVTGPLVGYAFDLWGMRTTLLLLALVSTVIALAIVLPLALAVRFERADPKGAAEACGPAGP